MFEIGKIPPETLEKIVMEPISGSKVRRKDVVLRPKTGEDCSAIDPDGEFCVLSTDPITGATKDIGYLAVQINCNDVYAAGGEPVGILMTVLLPYGSGEEDLREIIQGALQAAGELNIEILGGHTEVTDAVCKPVVSATVIGKTKNRRIIETGGAYAGEDVVMTKWAGLEGTAILAKEYEKELGELVPTQFLENAKDMKQFLSVGKEAQIALDHGATAMHDATEGGVLGAVWEMAECSVKGLEIQGDAILLKEETKAICKAAGIDPLRLISSGTMVIGTVDGVGLVEKLKAAGIESAVIGRITEKGKYLLTKDGKQPLCQPESDALYQVNFKRKSEE